MADPPQCPAGVPRASPITASNSSSVISPQVVGSHVEGSRCEKHKFSHKSSLSAQCWPMVQVSGIVLEDMDVFRLCSSLHGQRRLVSVVRNCRQACSVNCHPAMAVISALLSSISHLEKLEFRQGWIMKYKSLVDAVKAPEFRLKELHFTHIHWLFEAKQESWVEAIRAALLGPHDQPRSFTNEDACAEAPFQPVLNLL
ncbi:hypothetical protein AOLI_G00232720 [Acnodon oligacanthus]